MSGLQMFQSVFTFRKNCLCDDVLERADYWRQTKKNNTFPHSGTLYLRKHAKMNLRPSVRYVAAWKGALCWGFFFFLQKKETEQKWGKAKPQCEGKKNPPVSSEAGALQGSFSNNCTMFSFPLKDYISALEPIHWLETLDQYKSIVRDPGLNRNLAKVLKYRLAIMYLEFSSVKCWTL